MKQKYGKLVRDKIPEIIEANGSKSNFRILEDSEIDQALLDKVYEELGEFDADRTVEELADIQEVLDTIRQRIGITRQELEAEQLRKREERGGFEGRIYLIEVEDV